MTTSASNMIVTITSRTSRLRFLSQITKFALTRVNGSRDFSIRKSMMASSRLNTPLSTLISPVMLFSNLWCPIQKGFEYLPLSQRSNSSRVVANSDLPDQDADVVEFHNSASGDERSKVEAAIRGSPIVNFCRSVFLAIVCDESVDGGADRSPL